MKKFTLIAALGLFSLNITAQGAPKEGGFVSTTVKEDPIASIKSQNRSGICWSFSDLGFLESELPRMGKGKHDLSEMFVVHHTIVDRTQNYVRYHSNSSLPPDGSFYDIIFCLKNYGLVPQEAMPGIMYGDTLPVHNELNAVADAYTDAIARDKLTRLSPVRENGLNAIYDTYLGRCPERFTYKGKEYAPETFGESLGINPDDYASLTSYIHHPFYTQFAIEIQDSQRNDLSWNLPIDELMTVMNNAVKEGYAFTWGGDVSERGFTHDGIAVIPDTAHDAELTGSDMARWVGLTAADKRKGPTSKSLPEVNVTQKMRQAAFDDWETTGDHDMVIHGIAKDQNGKECFIVKNSWGLNGEYKGIWYASKAFVTHKTMNILVHKGALLKDIAKRLEFK